MRLSDFNFELPGDLVADKPLGEREQSRLLVLNHGQINHLHFRDIIQFLNKRDVLVFNNTKVFPARLIGSKRSTGGRVEILLNRQVDGYCWEAIGKNLKVGDLAVFENSNLQAAVESKADQIITIRLNLSNEALFSELDKIGKVPLPPYIEAKRKKDHTKYDKDRERYQTVYAKNRGSVAAPTAGLHFSKGLIETIRGLGVKTYELTLHVGLGTFASVDAENIKDHKIHKEFYSIAKDTFNNLLRLKRDGYRIISVGTTTARVLESVYREYPDISLNECVLDGWTDIYIYPGYRFKFVDGLITNFHLPKSSLLFLVSAFAGRDNILNAYKDAIKQRYRFYSYGDAMFICSREVK